MRIIKKAISKIYEIKCSHCGSILECDEEYDIVWMYSCTGNRAAKIYCPVCDDVHITKAQRDIKERITYEDEEYVEDDEEFEEEEA